MPSEPEFGDRARDELIVSHLYLVAPIARSLVRRLPRSFELDDLESAGMLGLVLAARQWDPSRVEYGDGDYMFITFARMRIRGAILDSVRGREYKEATMEPLEAVFVGRKAGLDPDLLLEKDLFATTAKAADPGPDPEKLYAKREMERLVRRLVDQLEDRELVLIEDHYRGGRTLHSIGKERFGVGPARMSHLHTKALEVLQEELELLGIRQAA